MKVKANKDNKTPFEIINDRLDNILKNLSKIKAKNEVNSPESVQ